MNRIQYLQKLVDENNFKSYLEIGTFQGESFLPIKCETKIAVDPDFQISKKNKLRWIWKNPVNLRNRYFQMTSDQFFASNHELLSLGVDLIFIDGLHNFKASLNDCLNALNYLNQSGLIIIHDCLPPNAAAATPAKSIEDANKMEIPGWKWEWCGDVWKTILYLRKGFPEQLDVCTLDFDYGLGVVRILDSNLNLEINEKLYNEIADLKYEDLKENVLEYLNLKKYLLKQ